MLFFFYIAGVDLRVTSLDFSPLSLITLTAKTGAVYDFSFDFVLSSGSSATEPTSFDVELIISDVITVNKTGSVVLKSLRVDDVTITTVEG